MTFEDDEPHAVKMTFGQGYGYDNPDEGKGFIYKDEQGLLIKFVQSGGKVATIRMTDSGIILGDTNINNYCKGNWTGMIPVMTQAEAGNKDDWLLDQLVIITDYEE